MKDYGIETEVVRVTPEMAKDWLEYKNYEDNRPISNKRVQFYARQIKQGRWALNGETIVFDKDDRLLNGQHRLRAIIVANKAMDVLVVRGVEQNVFTTMDQGYTRSGAQVLKMKGYTSSSTRSAICRAMYCWETNNGSLTRISKKVSPDELLLVQECYEEEVNEAVHYADRVRREVPMSCGLIGMAHILFTRARPRKAREFLDIFETGLTIEKGHPALVMRKRLINDKLKDKSMTPEIQWCALVRAWNNYDKGNSIRTILVKRNPDGELVHQPIRGLGRKKTGGQIK